MDNDEKNTSTGKAMLFFAWLCGFGLLILVFGDLLSYQSNPNQNPDSLFLNGQHEVRLKQNRYGHYVTSGTINNVDVVFLVDTGATDVAIPAHLADRLGLTPGRKMIARTANGNVKVAETSIETLSIGDIVLYNVDANLNPGMNGNDILLGMSVLKQLEFTQRGEWLILKTF